MLKSWSSGRVRILFLVACVLGIILLASSGSVASEASLAAAPLDVDVLELTKTLIDPAVGPATVGDIVRFEVELYNYGSTYIPYIPMVDRFDGNCLSYVASSPPADIFIATEDLLIWYGLPPLNYLQRTTVQVDFLAIAACDSAWNRAGVHEAMTVLYNPVTPVVDEATVTIIEREGWSIYLPLGIAD